MTAVKSKRQLIVEAIDAGLKTIKKENSYQTDLGLAVHEWREERLEEGKLPAAVWRETDELTDFTCGDHLHTLTMTIELSAVGDDAPAQLRTLIADVLDMVRALGQDNNWSGLAQDTKPHTESIHTALENKRAGGATVAFQVLYTTERFNAYQ